MSINETKYFSGIQTPNEAREDPFSKLSKRKSIDQEIKETAPPLIATLHAQSSMNKSASPLLEREDKKVKKNVKEQDCETFSSSRLWNVAIQSKFKMDEQACDLIYCQTEALFERLLKEKVVNLNEKSGNSIIITKVKSDKELEELKSEEKINFGPFASDYRFLVKNRYRDVLPYQPNTPFQCDDNEDEYYVNASMLPAGYIASQGPKKEYLGDVWATIWAAEVTTIVMLTGLVEKKREKCDCYWPSLSVLWRSGRFTVLNYNEITIFRQAPQSHEEEGISILKRELCFTYESSEQKKHRLITQYQVIGWQDQQPLPHKPFAELVSLTLQEEKGIGGRTLVHCSAGIGRTGTFILVGLVEKILKYAASCKKSFTMNLDALLLFLRTSQEYGRKGLVMNYEQYKMVQEFFTNKDGVTLQFIS